MCSDNTCYGIWVFGFFFFHLTYLLDFIKCCEHNKHFDQQVAGEIKERNSLCINISNFIRNSSILGNRIDRLDYGQQNAGLFLMLYKTTEGFSCKVI